MVGKNHGRLQWIANNGTNKPQPNDLAISTFGGTRGHISYVIAVGGDKYSVIESNKGWNGYLSKSDHAYPGNKDVKGWFRLQ